MAEIFFVYILLIKVRNKKGCHESKIGFVDPMNIYQPRYTLDDVQLDPIIHISKNRQSIHSAVEQHMTRKDGTFHKCIQLKPANENQHI